MCVCVCVYIYIYILNWTPYLVLLSELIIDCSLKLLIVFGLAFHLYVFIFQVETSL